MIEKDFLAFNERLKQRQAEIRKQSEPVRLGEILPDVLSDIQNRCIERVSIEGPCL